MGCRICCVPCKITINEMESTLYDRSIFIWAILYYCDAGCFVNLYLTTYLVHQKYTKATYKTKSLTSSFYGYLSIFYQLINRS